MSAYQKVTNTTLVYEAIRRLRGKAEADNFVGVSHKYLRQALISSQLMSREKFIAAVNQLIDEGAIHVHGILNQPSETEDREVVEGQISKLHPDAHLADRQHFDKNGVPTTIPMDGEYLLEEMNFFLSKDGTFWPVDVVDGMNRRIDVW